MTDDGPDRDVADPPTLGDELVELVAPMPVTAPIAVLPVLATAARGRISTT